MRIRLADGLTPTEGRIELRYRGIWGTVCHDIFDQRDAQVACRMAGFTEYVIFKVRPIIPKVPPFFYPIIYRYIGGLNSNISRTFLNIKCMGYILGHTYVIPTTLVRVNKVKLHL